MKNNSDYDIGVLGKDSLNAKIFSQISEEFLNIPALIDFVDFSEVSEDFKKEAMKEVFYLN